MLSNPFLSLAVEEGTEIISPPLGRESPESLSFKALANVASSFSLS